jgi:hypothetical protein
MAHIQFIAEKETDKAYGGYELTVTFDGSCYYVTPEGNDKLVWVAKSLLPNMVLASPLIIADIADWIAEQIVEKHKLVVWKQSDTIWSINKATYDELMDEINNELEDETTK